MTQLLTLTTTQKFPPAQVAGGVKHRGQVSQFNGLIGMLERGEIDIAAAEIIDGIQRQRGLLGKILWSVNRDCVKLLIPRCRDVYESAAGDSLTNILSYLHK